MFCYVDINECAEQPTLCGPAGTCQNVPGSYRCVCPRGYRTDSTGTRCIGKLCFYFLLYIIT